MAGSVPQWDVEAILNETASPTKQFVSRHSNKILIRKSELFLFSAQNVLTQERFFELLERATPTAIITNDIYD